MDEEEKLYKKAMERIDELVAEVLQSCNDVADENHYEKEWVLDRFRERFNKAKNL